MSDCQRCGLCCTSLIIELTCHDLVREPRLLETAKPFRDVVGPCGFTDAGDNVHDIPCHMLPTPCKFLQTDKTCEIYATRPNACVGFAPGGASCQELREEHKREASGD